jgi:hypothetical protein
LLLCLAAAWSFGGFVVLSAERGELVEPRLEMLSLMLRETAARALFWAVWPLGLIQSDPVQNPRVDEKLRERPPVLMIPGESTNRAAWHGMRTFLRTRGWRWAWATNDAGRQARLAQHAERIAEQVETLRRHARAEQVDLVAFGRGGLSAAWYVRHLGGKEHVRRLVTLGTPWAGTRTAVFSRQATARETLPGSHVLEDLTPPSVHTVSIWSKEDPGVVPSRSALAEGAESVQIEGAGHLEMLVSARVYRAVEAALSHPLSEAAYTDPEPEPTTAPAAIGASAT